jgi:hypothetical protein
MQNPLKIAPPPPRPTSATVVANPEPVSPPALADVDAKPAPSPRRSTASAAKFRQVKEDERVQFNKRVTRRVADGFEMLAIRSRRKVPELLAEALEMLEERYGRVG